MLQFKIKYQDVYGKPIACDVLRVNDIEEAINVAVDYCLSHGSAWGCEISNAAGFVVRMTQPMILVEFWSRGAESRPVVDRVKLPIKLCTPKNLARLAAERGSLFVLCPRKYGCRQIQPHIAL